MSTQIARSFQYRVARWLTAFNLAFDPPAQPDKRERMHRFLEEALELVQAIGCTQEEAAQLVQYVFSRPVGDVKQEIGGTMTTLAALCGVLDIDMLEAGETELARNWKNIDAIVAKRAAKPDLNSPLP